jgi:N-acetylmuramoyl-L-alanine amidase
LLGATRPLGLGDVTDVRHWSYKGFTRVVVQLSRPSASAVKRLPANAAAGRPERLFVDLPGIWVGRRYEKPIPVGDGLLRGVRLGQNTLRTSRLVLDLERYQDHRMLVLRGPDRVVIDVFGREPRRARRPSAPGKPSGPGKTRKREPGDSQLPLEVRGVQTVVLDPGHGGKDPGAIGYGGVQEKHITLDLARRLRPRLEKRGLQVVMTRGKDRTLSLEERTAIAAGAGADLFVSLHANAARRRSARGIETYYLDTSNERQSLRVAARENGVSPREFDQLDRTLVRLQMAENSRYSGLLAGLVHRSMVRRVGQRYRGVVDLGVKKGPFYVLFLSSMPSVLVETGFITNRDEARRLRNPRYLDALAEAIAGGLAEYRSRVDTQVARRNR